LNPKNSTLRRYLLRTQRAVFSVPLAIHPISILPCGAASFAAAPFLYAAEYLSVAQKRFREYTEKNMIFEKEV
jgi:hypothetical protein